MIDLGREGGIGLWHGMALIMQTLGIKIWSGFLHTLHESCMKKIMQALGIKIWSEFPAYPAYPA